MDTALCQAIPSSSASSDTKGSADVVAFVENERISAERTQRAVGTKPLGLLALS